MYFPPSAGLGLVFYLSESFLGWRRRSSKVAGDSSVDGGTMHVLWLVAMSSVTAGVMLAYYWPVGPHLPAGFPWRTASLTIFVLGTALRWWAIVHLGRFFTVDIALASDHRVIDTGPYRAVRHPSYTGLLMQYLGFALSLNRVTSLLVVLVPVFFSLLYRMRAEEAALTGTLGEDYAAYCRRTKRLVPMVY